MGPRKLKGHRQQIAQIKSSPKATEEQLMRAMKNSSSVWQVTPSQAPMSLKRKNVNSRSFLAYNRLQAKTSEV